MKLASAAFVFLLFAFHGVGDFSQRLSEPLSMLRDGKHGWSGYGLFAALLLTGALYMVALIRAGKENEAICAGLALLLLFLVAATPSSHWFHLLCSFFLLLLLFAHYWRLLSGSGSLWLFPHTLAPYLLVLLSGFHSYGLWQKGLILYFVILATIRHHLLRQEEVDRPARRRRKVYRVEPGPEWSRYKVS